MRALAVRGVTTPFPIQAESLPDSLAGRDVLGRGRTGTGKTVAFALPVITRILARPGRRRPHRPRGLVLVPTRELAVQVADTLDHLATAVGLRTMTVYGGVRYTGQLRRLEQGVDIVVATPGRLEDLIAQGALALDEVCVAVLDEADLMADLGFLPPVTRLLRQLPPGQRLLFSATLDSDVQGLVDAFLTDPLVHAVDTDAAVPEATHHLFLVTLDNKRAVLDELVTGAGRTLLFARTKAFAERLARELTQAGTPASELHGNLSQAARQRNLAAFADGSVQVLVATDIAARGIHVDGVGLVVHVDPPLDPKAFLHRSGRTARAGAEGAVVTLCTRQQNRTVRRMLTQAGITPLQHVVAPGAEVIGTVRPRRGEGPGARRGGSLFEPHPEDAVPERPRAGGPADRRNRAPHPDREVRAPRTGWQQPESGRRPEGGGRRGAPEGYRGGAWGRGATAPQVPGEPGRKRRWNDDDRGRGNGGRARWAEAGSGRGRRAGSAGGGAKRRRG